MTVWVKVCGVTNVEDARAAVEAGVDALGLNFVPSSKRYVSPTIARDIVGAIGAVVTWVGVVADRREEDLRSLRDEVGFDLWQLHGHEPPEALEPLLPDAYKAIPIGSEEDVRVAGRFSGDRVLVDAKVVGELGGTGRVFDWRLIDQLVALRRVVLAGGLTPDNVGRAVREVRPWGVDTASGVESAPGRKDAVLMRRFVEEARRAALTAPDQRDPSVRRS
jgi:phosphoribosylanthranilate isomerase